MSTVKDYYDLNPQKEWDRLVKDHYHQIEYAVTFHYLDKYLPASGMIIDAGGGPGRYAIELAKRGYQVALSDLSPKLLELAREKITEAGIESNIKSVVEGSITDMSQFADESFDAILCLGAPLSHLTEKADQNKAMSELARIAKPGAPIILGVLSKFGAFPRHVIKSATEIIPQLNEYLDHGNRIMMDKEEGFTVAHYFSINEIKELAQASNLQFVESATVEGIASGLKEKVNSLDAKTFEELTKFLIATSNEPSIAAMSEHMLVIFKK